MTRLGTVGLGQDARTHSDRPAHMITGRARRGRRLAAAVPQRATMGRARADRAQCPDLRDRGMPRSPSARCPRSALAWAWRCRCPALAHGAGPGGAADGRRPALRLVVRAADPPAAHRASAVAWVVRVRRVNARPSGDARAARAGRVAFLAGLAAIAVRAPVGDRALRHDAVLDPHGPAPPADRSSRRRSSPSARRSRCSCGSASPERPPALDPAGPPLAGAAAILASRSWRGSLFAGVMWATHFSPLFDLPLEDRLVHDLEHAAVPRRRRCCSGGRPSGSTPRRGGCRTRSGCCTCSSRCPRTRSWPSSS